MWWANGMVWGSRDGEGWCVGGGMGRVVGTCRWNGVEGGRGGGRGRNRPFGGRGGKREYMDSR